MEPVPEATRITSRPRRLVECPPVALLVGARRLLEYLSDRAGPTEHEPVFRLRVLLRELPGGRPLLPGSAAPVRACGNRGGIRGRGLAVERQGLAHAARRPDRHRREPTQPVGPAATPRERSQ